MNTVELAIKVNRIVKDNRYPMTEYLLSEIEKNRFFGLYAYSKDLKEKYDKGEIRLIECMSSLDQYTIMNNISIDAIEICSMIMESERNNGN